MQTKWQHLTPDECAANKSIYAKHLLIIIIRYAAHTRAYLQSTQPHTHTHSQHLTLICIYVHMETVWFMGDRLRLPVELFVSLALLKAIKAIRKKSVALSHTHTWTWTYTPIRACGTNTHRATYKLTLIKRD